MSAEYSPPIPSGGRSTQRRCQVSKPTQAPLDRSAADDALWDVDGSLDDSDEHVIRDILPGPSDLEEEDENNENGLGEGTLTKV